MRKKSVPEQLLSSFWLAIGPLDPHDVVVLLGVIDDFTFSTFRLPDSLLDAKMSQNDLQNELGRLSKSGLKIIDFPSRLRVGDSTTRHHPMVDQNGPMGRL